MKFDGYHGDAGGGADQPASRAPSGTIPAISGMVLRRILSHCTASPASIAAPISPTRANLSASLRPDRPGILTSQVYGIRFDATTGFHTPLTGPPLYTTFV